MDMNYFDLIVIGIVLFLGLKGIINGFFKELFGLVGIIGGIFIASRFGDILGQYLSDFIFKFENQSAVSFTGFLVTLLAFWVIMIFAGMLFKKLSKLSGLGMVDRILGFVFGASKFFLIASVIAYSLTNVNALSDLIQSKTQDSKMYPILVEVGGMIMKLDTEKLNGEITAKIDDAVSQTTTQITDSVKEKLEETMKESIDQVVEEHKSH